MTSLPLPTDYSCTEVGHHGTRIALNNARFQNAERNKAEMKQDLSGGHTYCCDTYCIYLEDTRIAVAFEE